MHTIMLNVCKWLLTVCTVHFILVCIYNTTVNVCKCTSHLAQVLTDMSKLGCCVNENFKVLDLTYTAPWVSNLLCSYKDEHVSPFVVAYPVISWYWIVINCWTWCFDAPFILQCRNNTTRIPFQGLWDMCGLQDPGYCRQNVSIIQHML